MRTATLTLFIFFLIVLPGQAKVIEVPKDYPTIQAAIDSTVDGDTVLVSPGTYVENIDFLGKAITVASTDGPDATVIDGAQNGSVVKFVTDEGSDSVLEGFTITNGSGTYGDFYGYMAYQGGGIHCDKASPTITSNHIEWNEVDVGGGIHCKNGSAPHIAGNRICNNTAFMVGGGLAAVSNCAGAITDNVISFNIAHVSSGGICLTVYCSPSVSGNLIEGNFASGPGAGIYCHSRSSPVIANNYFVENQATEAGGGISCWGTSNPEIVNNTLFQNQAGTYGGGICCRDSSSPVITNNTIMENEASTSGGGLGCLSNSFPVVKNTISRENISPVSPEIYGEPVVTFSNVEGGWAGTGNIDADPLFVDAAYGDFHLTCDSPCRDAGDNSAVTEAFDFEGDPRIADGIVDMGADEFHTHLYHRGGLFPGSGIEVKVVGDPGVKPVTLALGSGIQDPPQSTPYGDLYLVLPPLRTFNLGAIPNNGVCVVPAIVPAIWQSGESYPFQALVGPMAPGSALTNLMILAVE